MRRPTTAGEGEVFDRTVEAVTARAADFRALERAVGRFEGVPVLHGGRKPAPGRAVVVHVRRTVQEHHPGLHLILPVQSGVPPGPSGPGGSAGYGLASKTALNGVS